MLLLESEHGAVPFWPVASGNLELLSVQTDAKAR